MTLSIPVSRGVALALPLLLAACSGSEGPEVLRSCPGLVGVDEAMRQTHFVGGGRDLTDVDFTARVEDVRYGCIYEQEDEATNVRTELLVQILAARGPANRDGVAQVSYFIALGYTGGEGAPEILARESYEATARFEGNRNTVLMNDELSITFPLPAGRRGDDYGIFVGLVLDEDEVAYNRRQAVR